MIFMPNIIDIALEFDSDTLENIGHSHKSDDLKLDDVIKAWNDTQPSPVTWKTLINTIEEPPQMQYVTILAFPII